MLGTIFNYMGSDLMLDPKCVFRERTVDVDCTHIRSDLILNKINSITYPKHVKALKVPFSE